MRKLIVCGEQVTGEPVALERLERAMRERFNDLVKLSDENDKLNERLAKIKDAFNSLKFATGDMEQYQKLAKLINCDQHDYEDLP